MYCTKCGATVNEGGAFCTACGQPVTAGPGVATPAFVPVSASPAAHPDAAASGAVAIPPAYPAAAMPAPSPYAGFWLRVVAYLIDMLILTAAFGVFFLIALAFVGIGFFQTAFRNAENPQDIFVPVVIVAIVILSVVSTAVSWLYYAWMESSMHQGTLGKLALGLYVTDMQGRRISFGRASGRFFAKIITGLIPLGIGYILAGVTQKKQALHDMIASCLVLRRS
ncbi:MAG: RDD family protein [Candidatus Acidiferrales bacterium]